MRKIRWCFSLAVLCAACGSDGTSRVDGEQGIKDAVADAGPGPEALYPSERILDVAIRLSDADFDEIRQEGRSVNDVFSGCLDPDFAYSEVGASVTVDGHELSDVSVRKKGWLGSLSVNKPSFRVVFDRNVAKQNLFGQKDLTLNNNRSDPALLRTCLAYSVFEGAGIPTPRCSLARVSLNGKDLGIYTNVEPLKKPFLRRFFKDPSGNLYEGGGGADFRADSLERFEKKTNESDLDRSELVAITKALEDPDSASLEARLSKLIDLDQFLRFWAVESLVGHWDGYTGDLNNFFVYQDPSQNRLVFLPWGPDGAFSATHPFLPAGQRPALTYAWARLPRQLYENTALRARYHETLRNMLDTVWKEDELLARVDSMSAIVADVATATSIEVLRTFIQSRRALAEQELNADVPWTLAERPARVCAPEANTPLRVRFVTQWDTLATPKASPANKLEMTIDGKLQVFTEVQVGAGASMSTTTARPSKALRVTGVRADGPPLTIQIALGDSPLAPGAIVLHGFETVGFSLKPGTAMVAGFIGDGAIKLDKASETPGAPFEGTVEAFLVAR